MEVFGERSDGYHALRSVVLPVSLSDTLDIELTDDGTISSDSGYADDLCLKAANALRQALDLRRETRDSNLLGAKISVVKRIPAGGGLGGGERDFAPVAERDGAGEHELLHDDLSTIMLGHLSEENNLAELAYETVRLEIMMNECKYQPEDFDLMVASRSERSKLIAV